MVSERWKEIYSHLTRTAAVIYAALQHYSENELNILLTLLSKYDDEFSSKKDYKFLDITISFIYYKSSM